MPGEEEENENVENPFPEIIVGNPKCLNGCELPKEAFLTKRLEKAEPIDMLCERYLRDSFHGLNQALNQALTLMSVTSLDYDRELDRFWWSFRNRQNWSISKGAFEWVLYQLILYNKDAFYYDKPESEVES